MGGPVDSKSTPLLDPTANSPAAAGGGRGGDAGAAKAGSGSPNDSEIPDTARMQRADTFGNEYDETGEPVVLQRMNTYDAPPKEPNTGTSTLFQLIMNFINTVVGAGIVGLPFVFKLCGFYLGLLELALICVITAYSVQIQIAAGVRCGAITYEDLCERALGPAGYYLVATMMLIFDFGAVLSYFIIMADAAQLAAQQLFQWCEPFYRQVVLASLAVVFILPLSLLRDVSRLEKASIFSVITVIFIIGVVVYKFIANYDSLPGGSLEFVNTDPKTAGYFQAFSIVAFAFVCNDSSFLLYASLRNATQKRWNIGAVVALVSSLLICACIAVPGYLTFRNESKANLLNNYDVADPIMIAVRIVYVLTMITTVPISFFVVRHILNELVCHKLLRRHRASVQKMSLGRHLLLTLSIFAAALGITLLVSSMELVMSISGSIGAVTLAFILPPMCAIAVSNHRGCFCCRGEKGSCCAAVRELAGPTALLVFGVALFGLSMYQIITTPVGPTVPILGPRCLNQSGLNVSTVAPALGGDGVWLW